MLLWGNFYAFVVNGMLVLMTGAILPYLMKDFNLSYSQSGLLLSLQAVGNLTAGFLSGVAAMYWGRKATMALGAVFFTVGFGGILFISSAFLLFLFIFISGMGWGTCNTMVNSVVNDAAGGRSSVINLLHMFFSIGGFMAPFIVGFSVRLGLSWQYDVMLVALLSVVLIAVFLIMPVDSRKVQRSESKASVDFLSDFRFYIFMGIMFFYVGSETSINGWVVTYLIKSGIMGEAGAQNILSVMWVSMITGRLLCSYISTLISKEKLVMGCSISALLFFGLFLLLKTPVLMPFCIFGVGLSLAGIYPTSVANAGSYISRPGLAGGLLLSCGGLGASAVPYIAGIFAQRLGISAVMAAVLISMAMLLVFVSINLFTRSKATASSAPPLSSLPPCEIR